MSERLQHTATRTREKMLHTYGDSHHHKHNKNHTAYRQHGRSHPVEIKSLDMILEEQSLNTSTGAIREFKLRKFRKRLAKPQIH